MHTILDILTAVPGTPEQWANAIVTIILTILGTLKAQKLHAERKHGPNTTKRR